MKFLGDLIESAHLLAVICLDAMFNPAPLPVELSELGLDDTLVVDRVRHFHSIDPGWHPNIARAIAQAKAAGVGGCRVGLAEDAPHRPGAYVSCRVIDLIESSGVLLVLVGDFADEWAEELAPAQVDLRPRMLVHRSDESGHYLHVDSNVPAILGWTPAEMLGKSGLNFVHPDDHDLGIAGWLRVLAGEDGSRQRLRFRHKDGSWCWLEVTYTNHLDDDEPHIRVEALDVRAEMQALADLQNLAAKFETLAESVPVGVLQFDAAGELVFANAWARELLERCVNSSDFSDALSSVHPDDRPTILDAIQRALGGDEVTIDMQLVNSETNERWSCRACLRPLHTEGAVTGVIGSFVDVTERLSLEERLRVQASTDHLTGLPNRGALTTCLTKLVERTGHERRGFACLFVDIDGFKLVNDAMGHDAGDELLVTVADRLLSAVRPGDTVARVGGDEFVVVCDGADDPSAVVSVAERLMKLLEEPVILRDQVSTVSISIGIAIQGRTSAAPAAVVIGNADLAMYEAKRAGGCRWKLYGEQMRDSMQRRFDLGRALRDAVAHDEFRMHVQPIFDLVSGRVKGAEALLRWQHPEKGLVGPGYFIDFLADSDMMIPVGWWIIDDCCRIAARVTATGCPDFRLAVNVTGSQLIEPGFAERFLATVGRHDLRPRNLALEVTETVLIEDGPTVRSTLALLSEAGTKISLDDFGTGFSSLNHVRDMPVEALKIDRSYTSALVSSEPTRAIVEAVRDLAHKLGLLVVVEGVETIEERELLVEMGLTIAQGYLMARPCDEETFVREYAPLAAPRGQLRAVPKGVDPDVIQVLETRKVGAVAGPQLAAAQRNEHLA